MSVGVAAALALLLAAPAPPKEPLNLVLISIDTLRADRLGCYGYPRPTSPTLDALSRESVLFEDATAASPKTSTSHMTLFTGLHPTTHGVVNWEEEGEQPLGLSEDIPTLATLLRKAGYRTQAYTGGGNIDNDRGFDQGYESYVAVPDGGGLTLAPLVIAELARRDGNGRRRPFYLFLHTYEVHGPYLPLPEYARMFVDPGYTGSIPGREQLFKAAPNDHKVRASLYWKDVKKESGADVRQLSDLYDAEIRYMDHRMGLLLDAFRKAGLERDTLLVFLSDHGEEFQEHGGFQHNNVYQEILHIPLMLRLPEGRQPALRGQRVAGAVGLVDVLPTLLELLGLEAPPQLQGRSLVGAMQAGRVAGAYAWSEWPSAGQRALRIGSQKLIERWGTISHHDLGADPGERSARALGDEAYALRMKAERLLAASVELRNRFREGKKAALDPATRARGAGLRRPLSQSGQQQESRGHQQRRR